MKHDLKNPRPTKVVARDEIISSVLAKHRVDPLDFFSTSRDCDLTEARRDAARQLSEAGFTHTRIAKLLRRDRSTIDYYLEQTGRSRLHAMMEPLPTEVKQTVKAIAEAEGVTVYALIREWISERATYEAQMKARAA